MTRYYLVSVDLQPTDRSTAANIDYLGADDVRSEIQSNLESLESWQGVSNVSVRLLSACFEPKLELEK